MPSVNFSAVILRFRDLATAPGGTIDKHREIIREHESTWWGWWSKAGEKVPVDEFAALRQQVREEKSNISLFDSGQHMLYRAACSGLRFEVGGDEMSSPDAQLTPSYYGRERDCLAWFQFTLIEEVGHPEEELKKYTYLEVNNLFKDESRFKPFYGKRVMSTEELRHQERTVWFVREYDSTTDPSHELRTPDQDHARPQHFVSDFLSVEGASLLWLSDLHFSDDVHHAFPAYASDAGPDEKSLSSRITSDILSKHEQLAGLIVSGDFTWKASESEFNMARTLIENLRARIAEHSAQIVLCPGNHDLKWTDDPSNKEERVITVDRGEARQNYDNFYRQLFYQDANTHMSMGRRLLLDRAFPVEIASLNSSLLQQEKGHFQGHGFTGEDQRSAVADEMGWDMHKRERTIRVVVVHHDVLPTSHSEILQKEAPYSLMLDAEALLQWATQHRVDVILHGHKHQPSYNVLRRPLSGGTEFHDVHVLAMGSAGVELGHLAEVGKNVVGVITFEDDRVRCDTYSVSKRTEAEKINDLSYEIYLSI